MGRLKRKRPVVARSRKARDKKNAKNGEALNTSVTYGEVAARSSNEGEKLAKISGKTPQKAGDQGSVVKQPVFWVKARDFLQEVKMELKRVTWPTRKETIASTVVVIILVLIISFFLGIVDFGLSNLVGVVLR